MDKGKMKASKINKQQFFDIGDMCKEFKEYILGNLFTVILSGILLILVYITQVFSNYMYIDKETMINIKNALPNFGDVGRFGMVWIKNGLGLIWYNPYFEGILLLLCLWFLCLFAGYLFWHIDKRLSKTSLAIFGLIFLIHPTYTEQFLFQYQAFEVMLAVLFLFIGQRLFFETVQKKNYVAFIISLPFVIVSFGVYQSMIPLSICLYVATFLFTIYANQENEKLPLRYVVMSLIHFIICFAISQIIAKAFYTNSAYISNQVGWKDDETIECVKRILIYIRNVVFQKHIFYTISYNLGWFLALIALIKIVIRKKAKAVWYALGLFGLVFSPFLLSFVIANEVVPRAQLTLPFATAALWLFSLNVFASEFKERVAGIIYKVVILIGCIMLVANTMPVMRLFYTRDVIGKADELTTTLIYERLCDYDSALEGKPIVFIGHLEPQTNASCYTQEEARYSYLVTSAYAYDYMFEPRGYYSSARINGYFKSLGIEQFVAPTQDMVNSATVIAEDMPDWPSKESIKECEEYIIIKLSEPGDWSVEVD